MGATTGVTAGVWTGGKVRTATELKRPSYVGAGVSLGGQRALRAQLDSDENMDRSPFGSGLAFSLGLGYAF